MQIDNLELTLMLRSAAAKFVDAAAADYVARHWLRTHFRKAPRMNPLGEAVADLENWREHEDAAFATPVDKGGVVIYDGNGLAPSLMLKTVHDDLARRAAAHGMAAAGLINTAGIVTLGLWTEGLAERDLIGIAFFNGGAACCVPHGGRRGLFGTNPMAYAIPTVDSEAPLCLDMATTEIPFFDVRIAKEKGQALPEGVAVGPDGRPTTDAALAFGEDGVANLLPIGGGYKGYGLAMLIETLTGALVGSLMSSAQTAGWHPHEYGGLVIAVDLATFTDPAAFKQQITALCADIRQQAPAEGGGPLTVPGDRGNAKIRAALERGMADVDDALLARLKTLAA